MLLFKKKKNLDLLVCWEYIGASTKKTKTRHKLQKIWNYPLAVLLRWSWDPPPKSQLISCQAEVEDYLCPGTIREPRKDGWVELAESVSVVHSFWGEITASKCTETLPLIWSHNIQEAPYSVGSLRRATRCILACFALRQRGGRIMSTDFLNVLLWFKVTLGWSYVTRYAFTFWQFN